MNKFSSVLMVILALCIFAMLGGVVWLSMMFMDERDALNTKVGGLNSRLDAQAIEITTLKTQLTKLIETAEQEEDEPMAMTTVSFGTLDEYVSHATAGNLTVPAPSGYERYQTGGVDFDIAPDAAPVTVYILTENEVRNMNQTEVFYLEVIKGTNTTYHGPYSGALGRLAQ